MTSVLEIVIGVMYEAPDGRIARTFGWSGKTGLVRYYFDDGEGGRDIPKTEFRAWKRREDLNDFPNARDPRLPYVFDLFWDIKYLSDLQNALNGGHWDEVTIRAKMVEHDIQLEFPADPHPPAGNAGLKSRQPL